MDYFDDIPSDDFSTDKLERVDFAKKIAQRIEDSFNPDSSIIFGLTGAWGSGKTQVLKYIDKLLKNNYADWQVVWFTPWAAGDSSSLLDEYVATLASTLNDGDERKKFYEKIDPLVDIAAPIIEVAMQTPGLLQRGYKHTRAQHQRRDSWRQSAEGLSDSFVQRGRKTLIIADDIDRLSRAELDTFLKLLRGLGEIKGVYYLIAYDELSLAETVSGSFSGDLAPELGQRYLEKFVQYHFTMPAMTRYQLFTWLRKEFSRAFAHMPTELEAAQSELVSCMLIWQKMIWTPRSVRRFGANLELVASDFKQGQISILDLANIIVLRQCFPSVFAQLPIYRESLTSRHSSAKIPEVLIGGVAKSYQGVAEALLKKLFRSSVEGKERAALRTVDNFYFFDRYVTGLLPTDNDSELQISSAVDAALNAAPEQLKDILKETGERIYDLPEKLLADILMRDNLDEFDLVPLIGVIVHFYEMGKGTRTALGARLEEIAEFLLLRSASSFIDLSQEFCENLMPITVAEIALNPRINASQNSETDVLWKLTAPHVLEGFLGNIRKGRNATLDRDGLQMARFLQVYGGRIIRDEIAKAAKQGGESFIRGYVSRFAEGQENQERQPATFGFDDTAFKGLTSFIDDVIAVSEAAQKASPTWHDSWEARENYGLYTVWNRKTFYRSSALDF